MIRRHHAVFVLTLMAADALAAAATFVLLSVVRFGPDGWRASWSRAGVDAPVVMALFAFTWVAILGLGNLYRLRARWSFRREALDIIRAGALVAVITFSALFILKLPAVSRLLLLWLFPAQIVVTVAVRLILRWAFGVARARGVNMRNVLMIGSSPYAASYADSIERHRELGLRVIGYLTEPAGMALATAPAARSVTERPILGTIDDIETVLHSEVVDEVVICMPPAAWRYVEAIARICGEEGKIVRVPLVEGHLTVPGAKLEEFDGVPILSLVHGPDRIVALIAKRALDMILATAGLVVASPLMLAIAAAVLVFEGRPVLFAQQRVGLHGRLFRMRKFRSMQVDAEDRLEALLQANEISGPAFKLSNDPRLTRIGRFLRRTSLDELPQLWNVLTGEMSLVGPRPALPREVARYDVWHRRRLSMKPGITGLWQISARREPEFDRWVALDLDYIDGWSLGLDFKILFRTVPAMFQGR